MLNANEINELVEAVETGVMAAYEAEGLLSQLLEIVNSLPRTADGYAITPGMTVYCVDDPTLTPVEVSPVDTETVSDDEFMQFKSDTCYYSRDAAAEAAKKNEESGADTE